MRVGRRQQVTNVPTPYEAEEDIEPYGGITADDLRVTGWGYGFAQDLVAAWGPLDEIPAAPDAAIVPHFGNDGFRTLGKLLHYTCRIYNLHSRRIDVSLSPEEKAAIVAVCAIAETIYAANNAGPT